MKTTVNLQTALVKDLEGFQKDLKFKYLGELLGFFVRNAMNHINKRGYDSFLMKDEEIQLVTPMDIPQEKNHRERIYKKSCDSSLRQAPLIWHCWVYCLDKMQDNRTIITIAKGRELTIEPGSFMSKKVKMAMETGLTEKGARTGVDTLKRHGMIKTESYGNAGNLISVVGY